MNSQDMGWKIDSADEHTLSEDIDLPHVGAHGCAQWKIMLDYIARTRATTTRPIRTSQYIR